MTVQTHPVSYSGLIKANGNFRNLWFGQIVSLMGDWFNISATAILTAKLTNSGLAVGALFVIRALAQFVTGPFGGVLADRFNRKAILIDAWGVRRYVRPTSPVSRSGLVGLNASSV